MRKLALLFAVVLVVAACGDVDQADRDAIAAAEAATTTAAPVAEHPDDEHAADEHAQDDEAVVADHEDDDLAVEEDHADEDDDEHAVEEANADEATVEADRSIEVILAEFAFDPDAFEVTAGETVEFLVTNTGFVEHEFRLSNGHRIEEHLAAGHEDHDDDAMDDMGAMGGHHEEGGDYILLLDPGETGSITVTFDDDPSLYTEVACLIPGHYEAGMHTPLNYS